MIESTALDFWRKSKKPEIESYIIDHDFRKIQVKNTASYWILPWQDALGEMLSMEPDFKSAKSILEEELEKKGCRVLWGVKFHPELMEIESCYR